MSQLVKLKCEIVNPNWNILKKAIESMTRAKNYKIVSEVYTYRRGWCKPKGVAVACTHNYGVDIYIEDGTIKIEGDEMYIPETLKTDIENHYKAEAVSMALRAQGYSVKKIQKENKIEIIAVGW